MSLEDELRPAYMRVADSVLENLSDAGRLDGIRADSPRGASYEAFSEKALLGPHYLTIQVSNISADLMDGYRSEVGRLDETLPTKAQASVIAEFLSEGPRRAVEELRTIIDAFLEVGVSTETLHDEVNMALARSVMES